jgi:RNA polymerase sigma-70 factor (ECF subfamily)
LDRSKEQQRFVQWWPSVERDIYAAASAYLSHFEIEDIAQAVAAAIWSRFSEFNDEEHVRRWGRIRARWLAIDRLRSRRKESPVADLSLALDDRGPAPGADEKVPDETGRLALLKAINCLPQKQREVSVLLMQGVTTAQVAKRLGIDTATVRSHFRHARYRLSMEMKRKIE